LPAAVADEGALIRLSPRNVYRHPGGCSDELDLDLFSEPPPLKLTPNLLSHCFPFSDLAPSEVMTRRYVGCDRLPRDRSLGIESWRCRNISIEREETDLPLVRVRASGGPGYVARSGQQDGLLLVRIEGTRTPPYDETRRATILAPDQELGVAMPLEHLVVSALADHVRD
jgi:hypothetical protein